MIFFSLLNIRIGFSKGTIVLPILVYDIVAIVELLMYYYSSNPN
jgi:hypothetical protein